MIQTLKVSAVFVVVVVVVVLLTTYRRHVKLDM